jgi:hypothetical protein
MGNETKTVKIIGVGAYVTQAGEKRPRLFRTGQEVTVSADQAERLIRDGVAVDPSKSIANPDGGDDETGPPNVGEASVEDIAAYIKASKVSVDALVDLAEGNQLLAEKLLEAEDAATGGNSRQTAVKRLGAIANPDGGDDK